MDARPTGTVPVPHQTLPSHSGHEASRTPPTSQPTTAAAKTQLAQAIVPVNSQRANVTRVIDGDTIVVEMDSRSYRVRYIGVDTPEVGDSCAEEATAANAWLVAGKTVTLIKDVSETDRYGRLLRYVYVDDVFVNAELARQGYAQAVTYPPDVKNADLFVDLASQAREAGIGCYRAVQEIPLPVSTPATLTYYVTGTQGVNIRSCAATACAVLAVATYGESLEVVGTAHEWHEIRLADGQTGYIAAWLTSSSQPSAAPAVQQPAAPQQFAAPKQPAPAGPSLPEQPPPGEPPAPPPPPPAPQEPPPPPPAAPAFVCDCNKTCPMMVSCEEAYFQLNQCGCSRRDGDSDGVPCEEICPGG